MSKEDLRAFLILRPGYLKKGPAFLADMFECSVEEARQTLVDLKRISRLEEAKPIVEETVIELPKTNKPKFDAKEITNGSYKLLVLSDIHGVFVDYKAWECMLAVIANNNFDEIVLNGDILDFPFLSRFDKKLFDIPLLQNYSEVFEIEFTKDYILRPLRQVAPNSKIVYRLGNHEERLTEGKYAGTADRIAKLFKHYNTSELDQMLELDELNIEYDPSPCRSYFDKFEIVHGLSLAKNAPRNNIQLYMSSGTSGDSHRLNSTYIKNKKDSYMWVESGCLRTIDEVEYLRTANVADWMQGFVTVTFDRTNNLFYAKTHPVVFGSTEFNGVIYK